MDTNYKLDRILYKEIPDGKLYVEDSLSVQWHRHVNEHGPKPEAYVPYTESLIALEESICVAK